MTEDNNVSENTMPISREAIKERLRSSDLDASKRVVKQQSAQLATQQQQARQTAEQQSGQQSMEQQPEQTGPTQGQRQGEQGQSQQGQRQGQQAAKKPRQPSAQLTAQQQARQQAAKFRKDGTLPPKPESKAQHKDDPDEERSPKPKKRLPLWLRIILKTLRLLIVPILCVTALIIGMHVGYAIIGEQDPQDVWDINTWKHVYELVFN